MKFVFYDFPLTPSSNALYKNIGNRRAKSKKYVQFLRSFDIWQMRNNKQLKKATDFFVDKLGDNWIQVNMHVCLNASTIYSQRGTLKIWDCSNRIKACHDSLAKALDIDDKHYAVGTTEKVLTKGREQIIVELKCVPMKNFEDLAI